MTADFPNPRRDIDKYLEDQPHASEWKPNPSKTPCEWLKCGLEDESHHFPYWLVLHHGTCFEPRRLPAGIDHGEPKCCYANAFALASRRSDLRYVEGFATLENSDTWLYNHGWCIDPEGRVVDPTWGFSSPLPLAYRGIELPLELVVDTSKPFSRGLITSTEGSKQVADWLGVETPSDRA